MAPKIASKVVVDVGKQEMRLVGLDKTYNVSTGRGGIGDVSGSNATPPGKMQIVQKIGDGEPESISFKGKVKVKRSTPIKARVLVLKGTEHQNKRTFARYIYIHGTPFVDKIGQPVSMGCIRMLPKDVIDLYPRVGVGTIVEVVNF